MTSSMRMREIRKLGTADMRQKIQELRSELTKMRTDSSKGTLRKDSGKIRPKRKAIARMLTRIREEEGASG